MAFLGGEAAIKRAEARTRYYTRSEAQRLGWNIDHPRNGGDFLEEQEITDFFPALKRALGNNKPDFVSLLDGKPSVVIECKNDWRELDKAAKEAQEYAETISSIPGYDARLAVGVAGTPDRRVQVRCSYHTGRKWVDLKSHGYPLTQLPIPVEVKTALNNDNGTTDVQLPDEREFFAAAISISRILRLAKIEEAVRPKVIGAVVLALYHGDFSFKEDTVIEHINANVRAAIRDFANMPKESRDFLAETLMLSVEAQRLRPKIEDIVHQLERLNVRSIMRSGVDFLGQFYETFLRYGGDSKKLGIVFTPRHITRFCAELIDVKLGDTVYDPACGTGGFLVAAFDRMMKQATTPAAKAKVRESLFGFDTNATVWALAVLNMEFRGDGKSHIINDDCFRRPVEKEQKFSRALLNPPFSQEGEPETDFIDHALQSVVPGGRVGIVVKTSVMVDSDLRKWRKSLVENHHVEAVVTLPQELFYPTAAPTVVIALRAHQPELNRGTFLARVENDGFEISKKRRVPIAGEQLSQVLSLFRQYEKTGTVETIPNLAIVVDRNRIENGEEICAEQWLPSGKFGMPEYEKHRVEILRQISLAVANYPDAADVLIGDFENKLSSISREDRPTKRSSLSKWFAVRNGKSEGSKNYPPGQIPYVSSGDSYNGIAEFVEAPDDEIYDEPRATVSAFGQASIQPWRFCARGNGGSAVRVLEPKIGMSVAEFSWLVGQVNFQRWRFHYGRMALPTRLNHLEIGPPPHDLTEFAPLDEKLSALRRGLRTLMNSTESSKQRFGDLVAAWKSGRGYESSAARMTSHPAYQQIIGMGAEAVPFILNELKREPDHWFWALQAITGANPIPPNAQGDIAKMATAWVKWGKANGYDS